jgi:primosomal protein N' (replication factor Y)
VQGIAYHIDKPYGYAVPSGPGRQPAPGARVIVPFGRSNRRTGGIILSLSPEPAPKGYKSILSVLDDPPLIKPELIGLAVWLKSQTFCTLYDALRLMLPAGLSVSVEKEYAVSADAPQEEIAALTGPEAEAVSLLAGGGLTKKRLCSRLGPDAGASLPDELVRRGILTVTDSVRSSYNEALVRVVKLLVSPGELSALMGGRELTDKQKKVLAAVTQRGARTVREICYYTGVTKSVIDTLVRRGIAGYAAERLERSPLGESGGADAGPVELSPAQEKVYGELLRLYEQKQAAAALLCGVTGSGKTQVFMKLIGRARSQGAGVIVLVPEIALTPQAVANYHSHFGRDVAVLHSGLSDGERLDEWRRIYSGGAGIVVGTRSAVFAPVKDLGLIIIDEEQEHTYKSETSPRYHARDAARYRCAKTGSLMLLASATPSVESYSAALSGRYKLLKLTERYGGAQLPRVITVDMKKELARGNDGPISSQLLGELKTNLARGEQSILLLNRRGFSTFVYCADCGRVMTCPNCSLSLTYHAANGRLMCHFCGYSADAPETCPDCGGHMRYSGRGTQRAQSALAELLPQARVLRMDTDTTSGRNSHGKLLQKFGAGKYDILLGTQMVAKGLDFPNVTLVGVLSADQSLYADDFRAAERTFSLITQVVGRSGRGSLSGRAVIQTGTPDNEVIKLASRQDYEAFFSEELSFRRSLEYPPFCDICEIGFSGADEQQVRACAQSFASRLRAELGGQKDFPSRLLGPSPASVYKADNRYRYRIILKCVNNKAARGLVSRLLCEFGGSADFRKTAVFADMDPLELL